MISCLNCGKRKAQKTEPYGYTYCKVCTDKLARGIKKHEVLDMVGVDIKDQRKKYKDDMLQTFRQGQLSKEYVKKYPQNITKMLKEGKVTRQEVKNAKNTWNLGYYQED